MKYAVIRIGGKQLKVSEKDTFEIERQKDPVRLEVLMYCDEDKILVGTPILENISVKVSIVEDKRDKKIRVARFKSKSRYRKVSGHRQPISIIRVDKIEEKSGKDKETKNVSKDVESSKEKKVSASVKKESTAKVGKAKNKKTEGKAKK